MLVFLTDKAYYLFRYLLFKKEAQKFHDIKLKPLAPYKGEQKKLEEFRKNRIQEDF
jgi:hypothetical protein